MNIKDYEFYYQLRALPFVKELWLHGSRARGNSHKGSDVDLVVICPQATDGEWTRIEEIIQNANAPFKIDFVRLEALPEMDRFRENILKNHTVLFKKESTIYPWYDSFFELGEALDRLKQAIDQSETTNPLARDGTIQRFEFSVELFWKTLKKICMTEEYEAVTPREVIEKSFEIQLIDNAEVWHAMLKDRNVASHLYQQFVAKDIYYRIDAYYKHMKQAYDKIKGRYHL